MQSPDAVPCDADATRIAVKAILNCYATKVATKALARHLLPAAGMANPSARRVGSRTRRLGSQTAAFPSSRAIPALIPATVVEPPEHIRHAAGVVHPAAEHGQDLPEDVLMVVSEITRQHAEGCELAAPRKAAIKALQRAVKALEPVNAKLDAVLPSHVLGMVQRPNIALLSVLEQLVRSPDPELPADMAAGMPVVGDIPRQAGGRSTSSSRRKTSRRWTTRAGTTRSSARRDPKRPGPIRRATSLLCGNAPSMR